jgi:type VII secretion-associated serine protease mycosin
VLTRAGTVVLAGTLLFDASPAVADEVRRGQRQVIEALDLRTAWRTSKGAGVSVAVLDSGVDPGHRDLVGSVTVGKDFVDGANPPGVPPLRMHGTYMASLIAGHGHGPDGRFGVIGVAPEAGVLSVRVILEDEEPGFRTFNTDERFENSVADGIRYAVDQGVDVINLSISKELPNRRERAAIRYAISKGVVLVAAAGNQGADGGTVPYSYPASFPGVVSVGAADGKLRRASFSKRNSSVVVAAPGVDIMGAGPDGGYWVGKGTSQATALVSGVVALIKAKYPGMSPPLVAQALAESATDRPPEGYDTGTGFGVVNAAKALAEAGTLARHTVTAAAGQAHDPARPLGAGPSGPVKVVHRDGEHIMAYGSIAAALVAAALGSLVAIFVLVRRVRRAPPRQDA